MSSFQIVVLGIFSALIIIGVGVFAAFGGVFTKSSVGVVVVWGTLDQQIMDGVTEVLRTSDNAFESVTYVEKDPKTYNADLVNAMANGTGPDLFTLCLHPAR